MFSLSGKYESLCEVMWLMGLITPKNLHFHMERMKLHPSCLFLKGQDGYNQKLIGKLNIRGTAETTTASSAQISTLLLQFRLLFSSSSKVEVTSEREEYFPFLSCLVKCSLSAEMGWGPSFQQPNEPEGKAKTHVSKYEVS